MVDLQVKQAPSKTQVWSVREESSEDMEFLRRLYATTRPDIDQAPIPEEHKSVMKQQQFELQHRHYRTHFSKAHFEIILVERKPVGRVYSNADQDEIRIIDLSLLPEWRNEGIGTEVLQHWQKIAQQRRLPLRLRVECDSPAKRLYDRLGFEVLEQEGPRFHMEWRPGTRGGAA